MLKGQGPAIRNAVFGVFLYSVQNTLIELRLKAYSMPHVLVVVYSTMIACAFIHTKFESERVGLQHTFPSGWDFVLALVTGIVFFYGDLSFYRAFQHEGGNVIMITMVAVIAYAFFAGGFQMAIIQRFLTRYHFVGLGLGILSVWCIAKGNALLDSTK